jgi:probable HAF family extracellular repeat protein
VPQIGSGGFRWRRGVGFDVLPVFDNAAAEQEFSIPFAVSDDGSTAVGEAYTDRIDARTAFLARPNGAIVDLGLLMRPDTEFSSANGVSGDGSIVVGSGYGATHGTEAFLYDDVLGLRYLKDLVGAPVVTHAEDVSADGSTLAGWRLTPLQNSEAMIFSEAGGIETLGDLDGAPYSSEAKAISSDGSTVVGRSSQNQGQDVEAFLWTRAGGMRGLGRLFGGNSEALDVSGDGRVVVGDGTNYTFIYTEDHGMMETRNYLTQIGGIDLAGWEILVVAGVSDDGQTFTGWARDPQDELVTWVATVPEPGMGSALLIGAAALASSARRRNRTDHRNPIAAE